MFDIKSLLNPSSRLQTSPELTVVESITRQLFLLTGENLSDDVLPSRLQSDIHPTYLLHLSDNSRCILKCSPSLPTRLLRREQRRVEDESRILNLLNRHADVPIPRRVKYESHASSLTLRSPYLIRSYLHGVALSEIQSTLSEDETSQIDHSLGAHLQAISSLTARNFGAPHAVHAGTGHNTWREAFLTMFEAILRDGEDTLVSIPYDTMRSYVSTHADALDSVTTPRLTVLDACLPERVLIDEETRQISGLLGLGDVLWGDPAMAAVLQSPSAAFLEGYGGNDTQEGENLHRRKLLYVLCIPPLIILPCMSELIRTHRYNLYRAIVDVVKHRFRPRSEDGELEARRALSRAMNDFSGP